MKKLILFFAGVFLFSAISQAQCPTASFADPGILCSKNPALINNSSSGASTYQWDFCGGDFSHPYVYALDDPSSPNGPTSMSLIYDGTNWFGFVFNYDSPSITRYDFGVSLDSTPTMNDLGNPGGTLGSFYPFNNISFVKEGNNWYGIFSVYTSTKTVLLSFGPNLNNPSPTVSVYNNPAGLTNLAHQDLKVDSGNLFLLICRDGGGLVMRLNYGNSITNTPTFDIIDLSANPSYSEFGDISLVKYCNQWFGFVASYSSNSIIRLDFGNSLSNTPSVTDLGNPGTVLSGPWSIEMAYDGDRWYAFEMNYYGTLNRIDFGKDLTNTSPTGINLTYPGIHGIGNFVTVAKMNSACYLFTCSIGDAKFSKIKYESPCSIMPQTSNENNPIVAYDSGGTYIISLAATDSLGNTNYFSDSVTVSYAPTANFSFQNTCFGDTTAFQNLSSFNEGIITDRLWDFGDLMTDTALNPVHQYTSPGKYAVSLTLTGNLGCNAVHTDTVIIGDVPSANFSANEGCSNIPVSFTDLTTIGFSNTIAKWHWDFGNNDTSIVPSPAYKYPVGGAYTVILTVTSNYNCSSTHQADITINEAPKAGFAVSNTCVGGTTVFTDTSSINSGSISAWHWDFGDTDTSSTPSPTHSYPASVATYNVLLVASSLNGCSDSIIHPVKINNVPVSSFNITPSTICEGNTISLTDLSSVAGDTIYAWHWDFGDTDSSLVKNASHTYAAHGTYNIVLTVYSQTSCSASSTQMVTVVESPNAGFAYTPTCLGDSTHFSDASIPSSGTTITKWHWDFGDGDTSNLANPVHLYDSARTHTVSLVVTDNIGCTNNFGTSVIVHRPPVAAFTGNMGCSSTPLPFFDASTSTDGTINNYQWTFGDPASGSADTSADPGPAHTFYSAGVYPVSLIITTTLGCSDTATINTTIQQSSAANFQYLPTCEKQQMIFTNLDTIPVLDSLWSWSFGDGGVSFIQSPSHYYFLAGTYSVTLAVTSMGGCVNSITKQVEVKPNPVADFVTAPACLNTPYSFQDISHVVSGSIKKWHWTFGNGDSSDVQFPQTIYHDTGNYTVSLRVTTDSTFGCTTAVSRTVHVYPLPTANFSYNPLFGSPPLQINFHDLSAGAAVYEWYFGDGDSSGLKNPPHVYSDTGKFNIKQVVYSMQGCADSLSKSIYIIKPNLDIAVTSVSYQLNNNLFKVSAQVANLGTRDISNYRMQASIQDGSTIDEFVNIPLPSGPQGIATYNFMASFKISPEHNINYYCIRAVSPNGETDNNSENNEKCATLTNDFTVVQPSPNPFSDRLQLQFILPYKGHITVDMFNFIGQKVATLYDDEANAGGTTVQLSTAALASQCYYCRFTFREQTLVFPLIKMPGNK